jgi:flagellar biosynthesis protein FliR
MTETALLNWTLSQAVELLIIMIRVTPLIFFMPVLGSKSVPNKIKVLFSLMTALTISPVVGVTTTLPDNSVGLVIFVGCEIVFGATLAIFARLIFSAVEIAGQLVGVQMGMAMAGVMDPQYGTQVSLVGHLWNLVVVLCFLSIDGHHMFFQTLVESFRWVTPGQVSITQATYDGILDGVALMFVLAIKIMAPATAALFFSHVAMGIVAKVSPQIPVMLVSMPMNIAIGLFFVGFSLNYLLPLMVDNFAYLARILPQIAAGMGGK